ncbi:protoheme IX farnesyltransferase [Acidimicrobium ferrooxidans DSM 10331]|uniref:Protoheme IX farnesyltransferase n=1 Tax=Acidimicrobium ferrooxidans (strain DSM 10331 / JCM 15462 / NBRC 103882 / ICP) TaxID=525909 RepID=C7M0W9_ACIFD|nr:protoheme IX farnesyltransferase [Acidimicrobium ferrooxidans DSM 10331]
MLVEDSRSWVRTARGYVMLTKPRIIELLLITTVPAMIVAKRGLPSLSLIAITVVGGTLAAGGANAANMWFDRDIDAVMRRTKGRPLVTGDVSPRGALIFSVTLEVAAFAILSVGANVLAASIALAAALFYFGVYTMWLKRSTSQNIVIGGAAGAAPVLVGWAAVRDELSLAAWLMFLIIFVWTPPHFWGLAFRYADDYSAAGVPMLPSVASRRASAWQIVAYSVVLVLLALVLGPVAGLGLVYDAAAVLLGAGFVWYAVRLLRSLSPKAAMRVFSYSITYLSLLFVGMAVDVIVRSR